MALVHFLLALLIYTVNAKDVWNARLGTVKYPKDSLLDLQVREGNVYRHQNKYYRAKRTGDINDWSFPVTGEENPTWRQLRHGSFVHPKVMGLHRQFEDGDIVIDGHSDEYYRVSLSHQDGGHGEDLSVQDVKRIDPKSEWMGLLQSEIGDKPLGDVVLPGTHDTGTWGIDEHSYLVDQRFLFQVADLLDPVILANWSRTQSQDMTAQLQAGFRSFDMRIADMDTVDGSFRWWHGVTGDVIDDALDQIVQFAGSNTKEIVILRFGHFSKPGDEEQPTYPIPDDRKDVLSELLISKLGPRLASKRGLSDNPTMNQVLATGRNVIAIINDDYILRKHEAFWPNIIKSVFVEQSNPEGLFVDRSSKLADFRDNHNNIVTSISGSVTPNAQIIVSALLRVYGKDEAIRDIIRIIAPELLDIDPDRLSFEGLYTDLLTLAGDGINVWGMRARDSRRYSSGASVHYRGLNDAFRHWLARPGLYKTNEIHVDAFESSTLVDAAIAANKGDIPREVTVAFQGTGLHGYYRWDNATSHAVDGDAAYNCSVTKVRWATQSTMFNIDESPHNLDPGQEVTFREGQLPPDTVLTVDVGSDGVEWHSLLREDIQKMIEENSDTYVRGVSRDSLHGFAYVSGQYNVFSPDVRCESPPDSDVTLVTW